MTLLIQELPAQVLPRLAAFFIHNLSSGGPFSSTTLPSGSEM